MTKLMAVFVILIMFAFIMPTLLNQLSKPRTHGLENVMWQYGKDKKITINDLRTATTELSVLRSLFADRFLMAQQDLRSLLLGHLLFPDVGSSAVLNDEIKRFSMQSRFCINLSEIDDFFSQARSRPELFLIILKDEARQAGCVVPPERAGEILNIVIPQVTGSQVGAAEVVKRACVVNNIAESEAMTAFADVLAIITYSRIVSDSEDVTEAQLENLFAKVKEKINFEGVPFRAEDFLDKTSQPSESQIAAQFEKYKNYFSGTITNDNPCGFGYKLMPRVALDYMIVKLDDIKKLVAAPTEEEAEDFYQRNLARFTEKLPVDANDPNSKAEERQKSYAEVADIIKEALYTQKTGSQGRKILAQAVGQVEAGFEPLDFEKASVEDFKSKAGDYKAAAEGVSKEHNVTIYTGRTALLSGEEMQVDRHIGTLLMAGQGRTPTRLTKLVFAVSQLGSEASKLGPFEPSAPKMYVSIGPLTDTAGSIMAIVRVVEIAGSAVPADIGLSYQKNLPEISESSDTKDKTFDLKDNIIKDCKRLQGFEIAKTAAKEFMETVRKQSWDAALAKVNASYGKKDKTEPNDKTFAIRTWNGSSRISQMDIEFTKMRTSGLVIANDIVNQTIIYGKLVDTFYQRYEEMQAKNETPPTIINFESQLSCYVVKSLTRDPGTIEDFAKMRQQLAFQQDYISSQSTAIEHFMPDNITKRLNLRAMQEPNKPAKSGDLKDANGVNR